MTARRSEAMAAITAARVVAIVRAGSAEELRAAADDLVAGGVRVLEVSLTSPGALAEITRLAALAGGPLVGAGTVLDAAAAAAAVGAGARFLLSPAVTPAVGAVAHRHGCAWVPGAATPTEVLTALEAGADAVKLFPASGIGLTGLAALRQVYPHAPFVPTGGIAVGDAAAWLDAGAVAVGIGGELTRGTPGERRARMAAVLTLGTGGGAPG